MKALLFDVQRFSVHDGPGIRTTVFLKGCPLRCAWCHNPEGWMYKEEPRFFEERCIHCGKCRQQINLQTASDCPVKAQVICGYYMDEDEIVELLKKDQPFFGTEGGITFSGGECLLQSEFVVSVSKKAKLLGMHTCIDTCGYAPWERIKETIDVCDLYLYDLKVPDREKHLKYTGKDNDLIISNLKKLMEQAREIWIRVPIIPGVNDTIQDMEKICKIIEGQKCVREVTLMPYHGYGNSKYKTIGRSCNYFPPYEITDEMLSGFKMIYEKAGFRV